MHIKYLWENVLENGRLENLKSDTGVILRLMLEKQAFKLEKTKSESCSMGSFCIGGVELSDSTIRMIGKE
jgi:hypothetical protein